jgi:hypothetical protein
MGVCHDESVNVWKSRKIQQTPLGLETSSKRLSTPHYLELSSVGIEHALGKVCCGYDDVHWCYCHEWMEWNPN